MINFKYWGARVAHDCMLHPLLPLADMLSAVGVKSPVRVLDAIDAWLYEAELQSLCENSTYHNAAGNIVPDDDEFRTEEEEDATY